MKRYVRLAILIAIVAVVALRSIFFVQETETVIVTLFGKPTRTLLLAGPYLKWPIESLIRFEKRLMVYDPRPSEFLTRDKKNLVVDSAVCWRIINPNHFLATIGDLSSAEMRLHDIVWATLAAAIGKVELSDLVSIVPGKVKIEMLTREVLQTANQQALGRLGIRIVDVQLKRLNFPEQNKQSVFTRMRAERERIAKEYRAQGEEMAIKIRAKAEKEKAVILSGAYREAEKIRGKADAKATRIYGQAHSKNPDFYRFLRTLESYRKVLDDKTTIILSSDSEFLKLLTDGGPHVQSKGKSDR
jgi:membrane protease subunit HflC